MLPDWLAGDEPVEVLARPSALRTQRGHLTDAPHPDPADDPHPARTPPGTVAAARTVGDDRAIRREEAAMSHEPHADDVAPGSTPGEGAAPDLELERQRAEGDMPGRPTMDPDRVEEGEGDRGGREEEGTSRVPPEQTVPDEVAEDAARAADPADEVGGRRES